METNGAIGDYDPGTGVVTIYANSMNFTYFLWLIAMSLKIPASKLKVVPVAAGGSFGSKFFMHKVPTFAGFLSMVVGRPVKYIEDRVTHIVNNDHAGSDRHYEADLAFDDEGIFRALRIGCVDDYGAYLQFGTGTHGNGLSQIVGPYGILHVEYALAAILTNKNQQGAYRGFGAEVSNWVLERLVDLAARDLDMDRVEIRRRNLLTPDQFPYRTPTGNIYDSGNYQGVLEKILEEADYDHWVAERDRRAPRAATSASASWPRRSAASSPRRSSGSGSTSPSSRRPAAPRARACRSTPPGRSWSRCTPRRCGATAPRPSSRRSWPRSSTCARVGRRDLRRLAARAPGTGPGGSRYTVMVSGAVAGAAAQLKEKLKRIASDKLEVAEDDLEFREGAVGVRGAPDRQLTLAELALTAYMFRLDLPPDMESGLAAQHTYDHPLTTLPSPTAPTSASSTRSWATPGTSPSSRSTPRRAS